MRDAALELGFVDFAAGVSFSEGLECLLLLSLLLLLPLLSLLLSVLFTAGRRLRWL